MKKQILNILPYIASGFLLLASGCTDEQSGIPVASGHYCRDRHFRFPFIYR